MRTTATQGYCMDRIYCIPTLIETGWETEKTSNLSTYFFEYNTA